MTKVEKHVVYVPNNLRNAKRKEAFDLNIISQSFDNGKTLYKPKDVKERLFTIYNLKCAYCEKDIDDEPKHVEHYRPKDIYYWLAYSWDNLLLSCGRCNSSKGKGFKTLEPKVNYNNESFDNIHNLGNGYDEVEKPLIINPEKENILDLLIFNNKAIIDSPDMRVKYTIDEACKLNKASLVRERIKVINGFRDSIEEHYFLYGKDGYTGISRFIPDVKTFVKKCNKDNEFYSFRYFIINNIEIFFDNISIQKIIESIILKLKKDVNPLLPSNIDT